MIIRPAIRPNATLIERITEMVQRSRITHSAYSTPTEVTLGSDLTALDAWEQVRARLSPEERLRFDMGQDVTVEMTREEYDAIENDPVRQLWQDMGARMGAALDRALDDSTPPAPA